ncbi:MAG: pyridoxal-phosphate dependent enzyme [Candidatus Rokuibacteriota bacterium]
MGGPMPHAPLAGLCCVRCGATFPVEPRFDGCPKCAVEVPVNLTPIYDETRRPVFRVETLRERPSTMWRYEELLPVAATDAVSLSEGWTPLITCPRYGARVGVPRLLVKDESRNPTSSFKDRLAAVAVSMARHFGAGVIGCSSSGNAGAAAAAYAARAGLPCVVLTFAGAAGAMMTQMQAYGAMVVATREKADRWTLLRRGVEQFGWYPTTPYFGPPVGSNAYGLEGYKTIAYEIAEQLGWQAPTWCVLPVAYGDALAGIWRGFEDLARLRLISTVPRMVASEIFGSLAEALRTNAASIPMVAADHLSIAASIATVQSTYQALRALRASHGLAHRVGTEDLVALQHELASFEGLYAEPSSVAPLATIRTLRANGVIREDDTVVALMTATGLKDPPATSARSRAVPVVGGNFSEFLATLRSAYGFSA